MWRGTFKGIVKGGYWGHIREGLAWSGRWENGVHSGGLEWRQNNWGKGEDLAWLEGNCGWGGSGERYRRSKGLMSE